ncbi:MAG: aminotransferase class I/II-fold pyridoxal phosphate-dependent enzyme [Candidatus Zixiibacteriota bacterium]
MSLQRFNERIDQEIKGVEEAGTTKGLEMVVREVLGPVNGIGSRVVLEGEGDKQFIRMNSNSYLGLSTRPELMKAEEEAVHRYGVGPGAVRFISGTTEVHDRLEKRLAAFHGREACMITSSAYTSVLGLIVTLTTPETIIVSDELNHNCIINAMRLSRPRDKKVYQHKNVADLEIKLEECVGHGENVLVITDGVFSMRGAYAELDKISDVVARFDGKFHRGVQLIVDDSHGVGALGRTGRGTEEITGTKGVDILVATLGKALGVNGGYIATNSNIIRYLREKNPLYIYTNPITPPEAAAAIAALDIIEGPEGHKLITHLHEMTKRFEQGLIRLGFETIVSEHPVVPLLVRDTARTTALVAFLRKNGILATGLNFPIVPKGDQLIRFQVSADHTVADIDYVLAVLEKFSHS